MSNRVESTGVHDVSGVLSTRENEVLSLASRGLTNKQIARNLDVTVHAIKFHLASVYRKLGVSNRTEAAAYYVRTAQEAGLDSAGTPTT